MCTVILAELGNAAALLASDRASAMTATLANITCGAFLDEQAMAGERALNDSSPLLPALNDRARALNAQRSTTHRHRPGGTSRASCRSWTAGAPPQSSRGGGDGLTTPATTTGMEVTRCSRDQAQATRPHQRGAGGAGSPAGSGAGHPAPSTGAHPPAGSCPTDPTHVRNRQPCCQADPHPKDAAARVARRPHPSRSLLLQSSCKEVPRQAKHTEMPSAPPQGVAVARAHRRPGGSLASANNRRSR